MGSVTRGRFRVRADGDPQTFTLIVMKEEHPDGAVHAKCKLTSGQECEPIDPNTWRVKETGQVLRRAPVW